LVRLIGLVLLIFSMTLIAINPRAGKSHIDEKIGIKCVAGSRLR
jgi:hypothetical protein